MLTTRRIYKAATKLISRGAMAARMKLGSRRERWCPACESAVVGFFRYGECREWGCPRCGASPRERLVNLALQEEILRLPQGGRVLQVAPSERSLAARFKAAGDWVGGDLHPERFRAVGAVRVDLMDFAQLGDFELIYASHVLEHVPDDRRVLSNLFRQTKTQGEVWLLVPLHDKTTVDGDADLSPRARERLFGQWDHVRQYGMDFAKRIMDSGFTVRVIDRSSFPPETAQRSGLQSRDVIFVARKQ